MPSVQKPHTRNKKYIETGTCDPFKGKKEINKPSQEKGFMADQLGKDAKTTIFKMLKEPKEDMEKVKKTMFKQNGNINKEITNLKMLELKSTITEMKT